jgi:hypothetical protein
VSGDEKETPAIAPAQAEADEDRAAILARRSRFVTAALAGLAGASLVAACSTDSMTGDAGSPGDASSETSPQPCLSVAIDATPQPCLTPLPPDASPDARPDARPDASPDATPQPCLAPLPPDAGDASDQ